MGEIADLILIGRICQQCQQPFAVDQGYPQDCLRCRAANAPDPPALLPGLPETR